MYVCICNAIPEREVRACAEQGMRSVEDLAFALGLGTCCGRCRECAARLLDEVHAGKARCAEAGPALAGGAD
jgi:bacterioferritin-associated ferredoxin